MSITQTRMVSGSRDGEVAERINTELRYIEQDGGVVKDVQFSSCGVPDGVWYSVLIVYVPTPEDS